MAFTVSEIVAWSRGRIVNAAQVGDLPEKLRITQLQDLQGSTSEGVTFFFSREYQSDLLKASPGVLITGEPFVKPLEAAGLPLWKKSIVVACADPYLAMALVSAKFAEKCSSVAHLSPLKSGEIHPTAVVHPSSKLGRDVKIGPYCVIEEGAQIGDRTVLYPGCFIGAQVKIGEECVLFPRVTVYEQTEIGNRVRLHAGVVLGADGFGYAPVREGNQVMNHQKIYHLGHVVMGDDVEVGANSCIDRGTISNTVVEKKAKIDDLVMIGHNVQIGEGAIVCGKVGIAGSAVIGKFAYLGGLAGISNRVHVGDRASVGGCSLVAKDVPPGETVAGNPQRSFREHFKIHAMLNRLLAERADKRAQANRQGAPDSGDSEHADSERTK
jgi:UDP-3-O-[3-hydroxymyristoyl] glucosamine N-acyltransferase